MKVYLVRHTSVAVPRGTCYGFTDVPLSSSFIEEASATLEKLKDVKFDAAFTSPLTRCIKLAIFCGFNNAIQDDRIKEMNFGDWEMQRFDDITDSRLQDWYNDWLHVACTNGESFKDQQARVYSFLNDLKKLPYNRVVVFTHGGVLVNASIYANLIDEKNAFSSLPNYGSVLVIDI